MSYVLNRVPSLMPKKLKAMVSTWSAIVSAEEKRLLAFAILLTLVSSASNLLGPLIVGHAVDNYIVAKDYMGLWLDAAILLIVYVVGFCAVHLQAKIMCKVGRSLLFNVRKAIFQKIQSLALDLFLRYKTGELISRINNDTEKLNQFFSQALSQLVSNTFLIVGTGILLLWIHFWLGLAALLPALLVLTTAAILSGRIKKKNREGLQSMGQLSNVVQESLHNFKVVAAFNRYDYFRNIFTEANKENFRASMGAGLLNNVVIPLCGLAGIAAQMIIFIYGIRLIEQGQISWGLFVGFFLYVSKFYFPIRQLASISATIHQAIAAHDRIEHFLRLSVNSSEEAPLGHVENVSSALAFSNVSFKYPDGTEVLKRISFNLQIGKTYALVGPTGGGKTTIAFLMAGLYAPCEGSVFVNGIDIRLVSPEVRTKEIGFILQEPILFSGTVLENIFYGNDTYLGQSPSQLKIAVREEGLEHLLINFENGLDTRIQTSGENISLGQRQLIAFCRIVLRKPQIIILDEATANLDTVTERQIQEIMDKLSYVVTKIVIAHRLSTIENADEILFVNDGKISSAKSAQEVINAFAELNSRRVREGISVIQ